MEEKSSKRVQNPERERNGAWKSRISGFRLFMRRRELKPKRGNRVIFRSDPVKTDGGISAVL